MKKEPFFLRIDSAIQGCVDAIAHALMRRLGINTHWVHFGVIVTIIASDLLRSACYAVRHDPVGITTNFGGALFMMYIGQRLASRIPAEPPKDLYEIMPPAAQAVYPLFKMFGVFLLVLTAESLALTVFTQSANQKAYELQIDEASMISSTAIFFGMYLFRTPNVPPPKKKEKNVLVPQHSEA